MQIIKKPKQHISYVHRILARTTSVLLQPSFASKFHKPQAAQMYW